MNINENTSNSSESNKLNSSTSPKNLQMNKERSNPSEQRVMNQDRSFDAERTEKDTVQTERPRSPAQNKNSANAFAGIDETLETVRGYAQTVTSFIEKRPVAVLLGAVAVGAAAALISSNLKSKNPNSKEIE